LVLKERFNPEISFDYATLERFTTDDYRRIADELLAAGLSVTFHAPFMDLRPGAIDPVIRQASLDRIRSVVELAAYFHPLSVVCHPSFDNRYYVSTEELWLMNSIETWETLVALAESVNTTLCLENVYEKQPRLLQRLLAAVESPRLRFCFDTGHFNVFSRAPLEEWIQVMAPYLFELHIHDNGGAADEHKAVGNGSFPFFRLFGMIREKGLQPIITLEAHNEANLRLSVENLTAMGVL
jgi:sugar phosphate isomerase/epimerase